MTLNLSVQKDGWLKGVHHLPSPNKNERPKDSVINLIVIHNISLPPATFGTPYIDDFFLNQLDPSANDYFKAIADLKVSSHLLIRRNGAVTQYVPFLERAWHAGISCYEGIENCNDFAIGIELEGTDDIPYTTEQYLSLVNVCQLLMKHYPEISTDRITGHCDIAPGRKTDPGDSFDWNFFKSLL